MLGMARPGMCRRFTPTDRHAWAGKRCQKRHARTVAYRDWKIALISEPRDCSRRLELQSVSEAPLLLNIQYYHKSNPAYNKVTPENNDSELRFSK